MTIAHEGDLETTYTSLEETYVHTGEAVSQGQWIGRSGSAHPDGPEGLHFGVKLEGAYVDPLAYLGPLDVGHAVHLAPVLDEPPPTVFGVSMVPRAGTSAQPCAAAEDPGPAAPPPNDNIAVAIAGINSTTSDGGGPPIYGAHDPRSLGYRAGRVYHFSYRGVEGPRFHEPYERADTYVSIPTAAERLRSLLEQIARRHPGVEVDLIAHSQGGLVARAFLKDLADTWDPRLPHVEHLVTFATPHRGAPLAGEVPDLQDDTGTGRLLLSGAKLWSEHGGLIPNPYAASVADMAPGSPFLDRLASEDVTLGTRVLAIAIPNDPVVPADRGLLPGETGRVVPPSGLFGHDAIVSSAPARALAYAWLRDGPPSCTGAWDTWGPRIGSAIGVLESSLSWAYRAAEGPVPNAVARGAGLLGKGAGATARLVRSGVAALWP